MHNMTAKWIPPNERSKFITAYFGSAVGLALAYPLFACVIHWASWIWVFHITGIVGTIWWFAWLYFVYDTPAEHPRISRKELQHIQSALGNAIQSGHNLKTPWVAIFTSRPVWMNVIGQWAGAWSIFTVMTQAPTYFKIIHNWDIRAVCARAKFLQNSNSLEDSLRERKVRFFLERTKRPLFILATFLA